MLDICLILKIRFHRKTQKLKCIIENEKRRRRILCVFFGLKHHLEYILLRGSAGTIDYIDVDYIQCDIDN